jgi:hypothetical protein
VAVDVSGWYITAADTQHLYVLPPGAVIPARTSCFVAADPRWDFFPSLPVSPYRRLVTQREKRARKGLGYRFAV